MKAIIKRPPIHFVIIVAYILAPVVNIFALFVFTPLQLPEIFSGFFQWYGIPAGIWLITAPLVGVGLYFIHRISWYIFLAHSGLVLVDFIVKWITRSSLYSLNAGSIHSLALFGGNIALILIVGYVIQKDFRAPYLQVLKRHWRESRRIPIHHHILLSGNKCDINDLSGTGCFVTTSVPAINLGDRLPVEMSLGNIKLQCRATVVRKDDAGYGLQFVGITRRLKREISVFLKNRFTLRYSVDLPAVWQSSNEREEVVVQDLSTGGCYVRTAQKNAAEGQSGHLTITADSASHILSGSVVWANQAGDHNKPSGFGFHFDSRERKTIRQVLKSIPSEGLTR